MKYIKNNMDFKLNNSIVTLGKFDGFHLGHMKLIDEMVCDLNGYEKVIFTFDVSPFKMSQNYQGEILSKEERRYICDRFNVDTIIEYPFTDEVMKMSPEDFVENVIVNRLSAKKVIVGPDFRFGYKRKGDILLLKKMSVKFSYELVVIDKVMYNDEEISSTRIRKSISEGDMKAAYDMLGYRYFVYSDIICGNKLGRKMEFPTVNQYVDEKLLPPNGVYAVTVMIDNKKHYGITNVGFKPTVKSDKTMTVETHIFDFDEDVYGKKALVEFYKYIRPEKRFDSICELKKQITEDVKSVKDNINDIFN